MPHLRAESRAPCISEIRSNNVVVTELVEPAFLIFIISVLIVSLLNCALIMYMLVTLHFMDSGCCVLGHTVNVI